MTMAFLFLAMTQFIPLGTPEDALASVAQLEFQLIELQKLMNQNIALSKDNRESLKVLVDELITGADAAMANLKASQSAHEELLALTRDGLPENSESNYTDEFQRRIEKSNEVDSATAEALQSIAQRSTKSSQFAAVDAQASVQIWQTLNRISMQLQELTTLMRKSNTGPVKLNKIENLFSEVKGGPRRSNR